MKLLRALLKLGCLVIAAGLVLNIVRAFLQQEPESAVKDPDLDF